MGEWDPDEVRRLFTSLEFRSLLDRLEEVGRDEAEGRGHRARPPRGIGRRARAMIAVGRADGCSPATRTSARCGGAAASPGGRRRRSRRWRRWDRWPTRWRRPARRSGRTTRRSWSAARSPPGVEVGGVVFDTFLAGYLLDPAAADYPLRALEREVPGRRRAAARSRRQDEGQLFGDAGWRPVAAEAAAIALLAPVMEEQIDKQGLRELLETVELPLAVGARADGGARRGARRRVPGRDGRERPRPDGGAPDRDLPRRPARSST